MIPEPLRGLCNLPDLILLGFLLFSAVMGASRGPVRTLISLLTRLGSCSQARRTPSKRRSPRPPSAWPRASPS